MTHADEWHAERADGIGGSDVAALLGLSSYRSPWALWAEKTGLVPRGVTTSERQRIGLEMEPVLASLFHARTGLHVAGEQTMCRHQGEPWMRCTVDGFVVESGESGVDDALGVVEFKTDGRFGWDEVPAPYRAQVVWQMGVTGMRHAWLAVMYAGWRFDVHEIPWDAEAEADWAYMVERAREFWRMVQDGTPPPVDGSDATREAIRAVWPQHDDGVTLEADQGLVEALAQRSRVKAQLLTLEKQVGQLDATIAAAVQEAETITLGGVPQWTYRTQERKSFDRAALEAAHPDIAAAFTRAASYRVLRPINNKEKPA